MKKKVDICISSPPDRNGLVAEISFDFIQWAEVNQENGNLEIEFYPRPDNEPWRIGFDEAIEALNEARKRLAK